MENFVPDPTGVFLHEQEDIAYADALVDTKTGDKLYRSFLAANAWRFGAVSNPNLGKRFWVLALQWQNENGDLVEFLKPVLSQASEAFGLKIEHVHNIYVNGQTAMQDGTVHTDNEGTLDYTILYYVNMDWHSDMGGATYFHTKGSSSPIALPFCPRRIALFSSRIPHHGAAPVETTDSLRMTLAYKIRCSAMPAIFNGRIRS